MGVVKGVAVTQWMSLFNDCHSLNANGIVFHGWPDGEALLKQEAIVVEIFNVIKDELEKMRLEKPHGQQNRIPHHRKR